MKEMCIENNYYRQCNTSVILPGNKLNEQS